MRSDPGAHTAVVVKLLLPPRQSRGSPADASKPGLPGLAAGGVALPAPQEARTYTKPCA